MFQQEQEYQEYEDTPEEEIETVYVTVYDEDPEKPPFWQTWRWPTWDSSRMVHLCMKTLAIALLSGFCLLPGMPMYTVKTFTIKAVLLPLQHFYASVAIFPTGRQTFPATKASGVLTVFNGSIFTQALPQGFLLTGKDGVEVMTDSAVAIPPENPPNNGRATVQAHTLVAGSQGNIPAGDINTVYGFSIYIKNLTAFQGGQDAYSKTYITSKDTATALQAARIQATARIPQGLLLHPCSETDTQGSDAIAVTWTCQFVTYKLPASMSVLSARVVGERILVRVKTLVLPS